MTIDVALGDVCEFLDHKRKPVTEGLRASGPYPYYGANGQQGWIDDFLFDEPLVLLAEDGGHFGSTTKPIAYKIQGKTWVNNHAHVLRPLPECDIDYLAHVLSFFDVSKFINGSTRPKLTKGNAENIRIPLPSLSKQRRLAQLLGKADHLRLMRRYALQMCDEIMPSAFLTMFGDPSTNPKRWDQETIDDVLQSSQYGTSQKSTQDSKGYPILGMTNITEDGRIILSPLSFVDLPAETFKLLKLQSGDIIFNRTNSTELVGKTACWRLNMDAVIASYLVRLQLKPHILPEFFVALLNTKYFKVLFQERCKKAVGQSNISPTLLREFRIYVPPMKLQQEFADLFARHEELRATHIEALRQADHLFQSLLQKAFAR
jgi:type I restriction enzyme S subunit